MGTAKSISLSGILLLCICFFLPQVRGCGQDIVPVAATVDLGGLFLLSWGLPFLFAIVAAVFLGLRAITKSEKTRKRLAWSACLVAALFLAWSACVTLVVSAACYLEEGTWCAGRPWHFAAACALLGQAILALVVLVPAETEAKMPACFFCCAVSALVCFLYVGSRYESRYGLWLSVLGCILIAMGSVAEYLRPAEAVSSPPAGRPLEELPVAD